MPNYEVNFTIQKQFQKESIEIELAKAMITVKADSTTHAEEKARRYFGKTRFVKKGWELVLNFITNLNEA